MSDEMQHEPAITVFRPDRPGVRKVLGDLEADIMEVIWARPPGAGTTARDVYDILCTRRRIAYTTVMNTMVRLAKKRLLRSEKVGQTYVYYSMFTHQEFITCFVGRILEDLLVGFTDATLERLQTLADPAAAARARLLLEEIARRRQLEEGGE